MDAPSQRIVNTELDNAIVQTDLRSVAECTSGAQTAAIRGYEFDDICVEQYGIETKLICLNDKLAITKCQIVRNKKPEFSFIVTSTDVIPADKYNAILEILETYYPNSGTFGIFMDDAVLAGGSTGKRNVQKNIIKDAKLETGQLVYITQYEIPDAQTEFITTSGRNIVCPTGTVQTYRFGRWQCISANEKSSCSGDRIWDSDSQECVADQSRKPLCAARQTAVMVDDLWECIDPFVERTCPTNMIARLNYTTLEWECVEDPSKTQNVKKCIPASGAIYGTVGSTLRIPVNNCTDCEEMITDTETCVTYCVPSLTRLNDPKCYPNPGACTGPSRGFYFGFPDNTYAARVSAIAGYKVPYDATHSTNRKFNCLDCGAGRIDKDLSAPPYIAVCE